MPKPPKTAKRVAPVKKAVSKQTLTSTSPKQSAPCLAKPAVKKDQFLDFDPAEADVYAVDGSSIKGSGFKHLSDIVEAKDAVLISTKTLRVALVVKADEAKTAMAAARLYVDVAFFRANFYEIGRLSRFLQEPIIVTDEENDPFLIVLPRDSEKWATVTAPLKRQASPPPVNAPITQIVLPPNVPMDQIKIAEAIGDRIGANLATSIQELTAAFRGFTRDAALAAAVASDEAGKSHHD